MWLLLVEDEKRLADSLRRGLEEEGYTVDVACDGAEGYTMGLANDYDVMIVDWRLPRKDGRTLVAQLRAEGQRAPILMLTALGDVDHRVAGLDAGADDYITKPFAFEELLARLRARTRHPAHTDGLPWRTVGPLQMDTARRTVSVAGTALVLRPKEYALLEAFMRQPDRTFSRTVLAERVWGAAFHVSDNVIDVTISGLRQKLADALTGAGFDAGAVHIQTVWGVGYRLCVQEEGEG